MQPESGILSADYKVEGGKLLRVRLEVTEPLDGTRVIASITILGDFFMHPEEAIEELERLLTGVPMEAGALATRVHTFFESDVQIIGAGVDDFVHVILKAADVVA